MSEFSGREEIDPSIVIDQEAQVLSFRNIDTIRSYFGVGSHPLDPSIEIGHSPNLDTFSLQLEFPDPTGTYTHNIEHKRAVAGLTMAKIRHGLHADNRGGKAEDSIAVDPLGHKVKEVIWQSQLPEFANMTVIEREPIDDYPDDLLGFTATVRVVKRDEDAGIKVEVPTEPQSVHRRRLVSKRFTSRYRF